MFFSRKKPNPTSSTFWFVGLHISSRARKLEAALIGVADAKPGADVALSKSVSYDLPEELSQLYATLCDETFYDEETLYRSATSGAEDASQGGKRSRGKAKANELSTFARLLDLRAMVVMIEEEALEELLRDSGVALSDVVLVAVNEPTLATRAPDRPTRSTRVLIGSGALLAERLGVNVVDSLRLRYGDELPGGDPNLLLAYWTLLSSSGDQDKLLVDFGEKARWSYIPSASKGADSWKNARYVEVAPCGTLLDPLTLEVSKGETSIDAGGKYSAQGIRSTELLDFWRAQGSSVDANAVCRRLTSPRSALNERFYLESLPRFGQKISSLDALCTAASLIAESTVESIKSNGSSFAESYDIIFIGSAKRNGLIMSRASALLAPKTPRTLEEFGFLEDSFDGVAVALLGAFYASNVAAAVSEYYGVSSPQALGRLNVGAGSFEKLVAFRAGTTK